MPNEKTKNSCNSTVRSDPIIQEERGDSEQNETASFRAQPTRVSATSTDWVLPLLAPHRFPHLTEIDLVAASVDSQSPRSSTGIFFTLLFLSSPSTPTTPPRPPVSSSMTSDSKPSPAVAPISGSLPSLSEPTQATPPVAAEGPTLLELELHRCTDDILFWIASFENLQILWAIGFVEELYDDLAISDVGLIILMHRCQRVKPELSGYEGSFDGISTIGENLRAHAHFQLWRCPCPCPCPCSIGENPPPSLRH